MKSSRGAERIQGTFCSDDQLSSGTIDRVADESSGSHCEDVRMNRLRDWLYSALVYFPSSVTSFSEVLNLEDSEAEEFQQLVSPRSASVKVAGLDSPETQW